MSKAWQEPIVDHQGLEHSSFTAMCEYYNKDFTTVKKRLEKGFDLETALTYFGGIKNPVRGPSGTLYPKKSDMIKAEGEGVTPTTYEFRIKQGDTVEEALGLTGKYDYKDNYTRKKCKDHKGNTYSSITEMCRAYGIVTSQFYIRKKRGWNLQECLEGKAPYDHLGNKYATIKEMCKAWNVNVQTFHLRRKQGWDLKDSLEGKKSKEYVDHLGNKYQSLTSMCRAWGVYKESYEKHIEKGWSVKKALTTFSEQPYILNKALKGYIHVEHKVYEDEEAVYFGCICTMCNKKAVWSYMEMLEHIELHKTYQ